MTSDYAIILLKAVLEILNKAGETPYIKEFYENSAFYDGAYNDGYCLKDDIQDFLEYGGRSPGV